MCRAFLDLVVSHHVICSSPAIMLQYLLTYLALLLYKYSMQYSDAHTNNSTIIARASATYSTMDTVPSVRATLCLCTPTSRTDRQHKQDGGNLTLD